MRPMLGRTLAAGAVLAATLALPCLPAARGWWVKGHGIIAEAACSRLPETMPPFFRAAGKSLNHLAGDPDRFKNREAKFLRVVESPDHYIDLEYYQGREWPSDRFKALALVKELNHTPESAGLLPWALMEHFDRLAVAFYDHRQDPNDEAVRMKCIVYAGVLAHYTGDTAMPLHTTKDYDGRKGLDGQMKQKGIHAKIDGFPEQNGFTVEEIAHDLEPDAAADVWKHVKETILESHTHVERCYELDLAGAFDRATDESRAFILRRCRVAARFTATLWHAAWLKSATMPKHY